MSKCFDYSKKFLGMTHTKPATSNHIFNHLHYI